MDSGTRIVTVVISTSGKLYFRDPPAATTRIEPRRALTVLSSLNPPDVAITTEREHFSSE